MPRLHQRNMLRGKATSCADEQLVAGNKQHVTGNKLLDARNMLRWCKRGFRARKHNRMLPQRTTRL